MKFCPECNNLLYYLESNDTIYLECNNCGHKEENDKNVLLTKLYKSDTEFSMSSNINYKYDPTLPRTIHRPCLIRIVNLKRISLYRRLFI